MTTMDPGALHVLVIEDNENFRLLMRTVLETAGIRFVREARDGVEALKALRQGAVDLVLADWKMAPMDGLTFVSRIRRSPDSPDPFLPILMVSAYLDAELVREARDAGVDDCLAKPITATGLLNKINDVLLNRRPFVRSRGYFGPCRRRSDQPYQGGERRRLPPEFVEVPASRALGRP